uniref:Uncharacterized protein n=1 Tax=Plectus sambesii TaxID=2011161 RepID=A0A914W094_9BILA
MATRNSSLNCITWLPHAGHGFVYGTNKGQLYLIRQDQGPDRPHSVEGTADDDYPISMNDWRILPSPSAVTNVL